MIANWDFILPALLRWRRFVFAALSTRDMALLSVVIVFLFLAMRRATSSSLDAREFIFCFLSDPLSARLAVAVTGIYGGEYSRKALEYQLCKGLGEF